MTSINVYIDNNNFGLRGEDPRMELVRAYEKNTGRIEKEARTPKSS
jgi:hypothetical protein